MSDHKALHDEIATALTESAPLAWRSAPVTCFRDPVDGTSCAYYHRIWQYLLLLGVTSSIRTDTGFLIDSLRRVLRERTGSRVLICGAADYGLLAHVLWAAALESAEPEITALDRCDTSLMLNRWYAHRRSATVATVSANILEFQAEDGFDIVCTHSFLGWFSPPEQRTLIDVWRRLLRPGGRIITTRRLRNMPSGEAYQRFGDAEAKAFSERVRDLALRYRGRLGGTDPAALAQGAFDYARGHLRYPTRSQDELVKLFEQGGFALEILDGEDHDVGSDSPSGPRRGAGPRLRIVARRRG